MYICTFVHGSYRFHRTDLPALYIMCCHSPAVNTVHRGIIWKGARGQLRGRRGARVRGYIWPPPIISLILLPLVKAIPIKMSSMMYLNSWALTIQNLMCHTTITYLLWLIHTDIHRCLIRWEREYQIQVCAETCSNRSSSLVTSDVSERDDYDTNVRCSLLFSQTTCDSQRELKRSSLTNQDLITGGAILLCTPVYV